MSRPSISFVGFAIAGVVVALGARVGCRGSTERPSSRSAARATPVASSVPPATARPPLPRPAPAAGGSTKKDVIVDSDPRSPAYDPVLVNRVTAASPRELFAKEPRDPVFALLRETTLNRRITERLRKRVSFPTEVNVTCRTSSCDLTLEGVPRSEDLNAALQALDVQVLAETSMIGPKKSAAGIPTGGMSIVMLFPAALRDRAAYDKVLRLHEEQDEPPHGTR